MSNSFNIFDQLYAAKSVNAHVIQPPANNGTIVLRGNDHGTVKGNTASNVTWKLPAASSVPKSTVLFVSNILSGVITVTNQAGTTIDTVDGSTGEIKIFVLSEGSVWNSLGNVTLAKLAASTGAAMIGLADNDGYLSATTVEAAFTEIMGWLIGSDSGHISLPFNSWRETTNFNVGNAAANGGLLASDTTPILSAINGATDGCQRLQWAASNNDQITQSVVLPEDLDRTRAIMLHARIASGGTTDAVGFTLGSYFDEGDTAIADATTTNQTTAYLEVTATIAAADIPALAQTLTIGLTPVAHTTDTMNCTAIWLSYFRRIVNP